MDQPIKIITWNHIKMKIRNLDKNLKYYGIPIGGQVISAMLNPVDTPEEADIIVDDLIDSGETRQKYMLKYSNKKFFACYDKQKDTMLKDVHLQFPWEVI